MKDLARMKMSAKSHKHLQTLPQKLFDQVERKAKEQGVSVPEYIRNVVIPEWLKSKQPRVLMEAETVAA